MLVPACAGAVPMFKCVDARGVTHYSEKPVPGCKGREVDIPAVAAAIGTRTAARARPRRAGSRLQAPQVERAQGEEKAAAERKRAEQRCQALKGEQARLSAGRRVAQVDAKGERSFMDDAARGETRRPVAGRDREDLPVNVQSLNTWLFVAGADEAAHAAAAKSGAHVLVQELEDFTPPALRPRARALAPALYARWRATATSPRCASTRSRATASPTSPR